MERLFFHAEIEARRELARIDLKNKQHHRPNLIQFDLLNNQCWQANVEAKQGRFQLDRHCIFAVRHGNHVFNPRDVDWIPNATDHWANCPEQRTKTWILRHPHTKMVNSFY